MDSIATKKKTSAEQKVKKLQQKYNITSDKFLTIDEIIALHKKQEENIIKDFVINNMGFSVY